MVLLINSPSESGAWGKHRSKHSSVGSDQPRDAEVGSRRGEGAEPGVEGREGSERRGRGAPRSPKMSDAAEWVLTFGQSDDEASGEPNSEV